MSKRAIELSFPIAELNQVAEVESYRKEIYRPIYHNHKWWAQRLGSVFRAIVIGATGEEHVNIFEQFYRKHGTNDKVVLDPFMGSGTTIGEALKLGCKAIGCDINPISSFIVRQSLNNINYTKLHQEYLELERKVKPIIQKYYSKVHPTTKELCPVLYYFWVMTVSTPDGRKLHLFTDYVFSKNAYPNKKPAAKIVCPNCLNVIDGLFNTNHVVCNKCKHEFNPQRGIVEGAFVTDRHTGVKYKILDLIKESRKRPEYVPYACLVVLPNGTKEYLPITNEDLELFTQASKDYAALENKLPDFNIESGHNTNQVLNYNFTKWTDFFNVRQLLCLNILLEHILKISDREIREQFLVLFSGTLEFNNMFCSFKGEGTGAVRHLFSNHILKPERVALENSIWGTEKSSGTFSTLFQRRLLKTQEYLQKPFELKVADGKSEKIYCNSSLKPVFIKDFDKLKETDNACLILNGDSGKLNLPDKSVDAVITDPPYFDFIHYSELSDFFYAWLKPVVEQDYTFFNQTSSRREGEVQNTNPKDFAENLSRVFSECCRVLKDEGLLIFSFHHSKSSGWASILEAIRKSGFCIVKAYPIKAEMSVSTPKTQAKSPINLDALLVCKKITEVEAITLKDYRQIAEDLYESHIEGFNGNGRPLSLNDKFVIYYSQLITVLSQDKETPLSELIKIVNTVKVDFK